jgi:hypothetical protein
MGGALLGPAAPNAGPVGYVDMRLDWTEVIDFNRGIG